MLRHVITARPGALVVAVALGAAAIAAVALSTGAPARAADDLGGWGPGQQPMRHGVVCRLPSVVTPLVSWTSAATSRPAFALGPVLGPPTGQTGTYDTPATSTPVAVPITATTGGRLTGELSAYAYLLAAHGNDASAAVIGDVAARLVMLQTNDGAANDCLADHVAGLDDATSDELWTQAVQFAGPYTVTLTAPTGVLAAGRPAEVSALVTSTTGVPVPGLTVLFASAGNALITSAETVVTDATGHATTTIAPTPTSPAHVLLTATVAAPIGLVEMSAPAQVPLVAAAADQQFTGQALIAVDTAPNPAITVAAQRTVLLPGTGDPTTLMVTGMHGHNGTAATTALGPLPFVRSTGCTSYRPADWQSPASSAGAAVLVTGDGQFTGSPLHFAKPGCYLVTATVTTTDATPNVSRSTTSGTAQIVTVPPLSIDETATGVAFAGPLTATMRVSGDASASVTGMSGRLLGPRAPVAGVCPTSGWRNAALAGELTGRLSASAGDSVFSTPVADDGCYAFAISATVDVGGVGELSTASDADQPPAVVLVLQAAVTVESLSSSEVRTGHRLSASVEVSGMLSQPGSLTLQLRSQPYTDLGCFGLDWAHATESAQHSEPVTAVQGDGSYRVQTPLIPAVGCWTVVPVLSLSANTNLSVAGLPANHSMIAFTAVAPPVTLPIAGADQMQSVNSTPEKLVSLLVLAVLGIACLTTLLIAKRNDAEPSSLG